MPRSKRWDLKRKCDYIIADINNALELCDYLSFLTALVLAPIALISEALEKSAGKK
jgi:hypothetical protein